MPVTNATKKEKPQANSSGRQKSTTAAKPSSTTKTAAAAVIKQSNNNEQQRTAAPAATSDKTSERTEQEINNSMGGGTAENVRVVVRCRPLSTTEVQDGHTTIVKVDKLNNAISITNPSPPTNTENQHQAGLKQQNVADLPKQFTFDTVFDVDARQMDVYNEAARPVVESCLQGFNGTILAYGQTGTGKTYTMEGNREAPELRGIIPNSFAHIFAHIAEAPEQRQYLVRVSYFEIYQEDLRDLLSKNQTKQQNSQQQHSTLEVKENPQRGVYVKDLSEKVVHNPQEMDKWMTIGNKNRSVGATQMNQHSSRSHAIFTITIERSDQDPKTGQQHVRAGKLHLVDLAGSERQSKTGSTGQRFKEATKINLALSALGNVISALVDGKSQHIPYRNSKLTRILQDSLGGNSKTLMIANCGPADYNYEETVNTLRYASRAKHIQNVARINEDPKDALLRKIYEQIAELKRQMEDEGEESAAGTDDGDENAEGVADGGGASTENKATRRRHSKISRLASGGGANSERRGSRIEKMLEMKAQILSDREVLLKDKSMADEERREMTQKLAEKERSLQHMQDERNRLAEKLNILQNSIIVGGENLLEKAEEQQHLLEESQRELLLRRAEDLKLRTALDEKARQRQEIAQKHATLAELLQRKRNDMQNLLDRVQMLRGDVRDAETDLQREREDCDEHLKRLRMDVARADAVIREYIPEQHVQLILKNCYWNDAINEYQLNCFAYTGNQINNTEIDAERHGTTKQSRRRRQREQEKYERKMLLDQQSDVYYTYATCTTAPVRSEQYEEERRQKKPSTNMEVETGERQPQQSQQQQQRRPTTTTRTASASRPQTSSRQQQQQQQPVNNNNNAPSTSSRNVGTARRKN